MIVAKNFGKEIDNQENIISPTPSISEEAAKSEEFIRLGQEIDENKQTLLDLLKQYQQADETGKNQLLPTLAEKAKTRTTILLSLLRESPKTVYEKAFSKKELADFPAEIQSILEKRKDATGTVDTFIYDDFENDKSYEEHVINIDEDDKVRTYFYPVAETDIVTDIVLISGTKVQITNGVEIEEAITEESDKPSAGLIKSVAAQTKNSRKHLVAVTIQYIGLQAPEASGHQKVLILFAKNKPLDPTNIRSLKDGIMFTFDRINNNLSYGTISLEPVFVDKWYELKKDYGSPDLIRESLKPDLIGIFTELLSVAAADGINLFQYSRFVVFSGTMLPTGAISTISKTRGITITTEKTSQTLPKASLSFIPINIIINKKAMLSILKHEFGHALGAAHASSLNVNIFDLNNQTKKQLVSEYGNPFSIMGAQGSLTQVIPQTFFGRDFPDRFNAHIKENFGWLESIKAQNLENQNQNKGQLLLIDSEKPEGEYKLRPAGEKGIVGAKLALDINKKGYGQPGTYYLEYIPEVQGLIINSVPFRAFYINTFLLPSGENKFFKIGDLFTDSFNNLQISVNKIDNLEKQLTFRISRLCDPEEQGFSFIMNRGGNKENFGSINVFENDIRDTNEINLFQNFLVENPSCGVVDIINFELFTYSDGNIEMSNTQFAKTVISQILPYHTKSNNFTSKITIANPHGPNTFFYIRPFYLGSSDGGKLTYELNLVPSFEEGGNDFEPRPLQVLDSERKEINSLQIKKGSTVVFSTAIANFGRNPLGNKSPEFLLQWRVINNKGEDAVRPFTQKHEGIPPSQITPAKEFIWIMPDDFPAGRYTVIAEADLHDRLREFNEHNNQAYRTIRIE